MAAVTKPRAYTTEQWHWLKKHTTSKYYYLLEGIQKGVKIQPKEKLKQTPQYNNATMTLLTKQRLCMVYGLSRDKALLDDDAFINFITKRKKSL